MTQIGGLSIYLVLSRNGDLLFHVQFRGLKIVVAPNLSRYELI